MKEEFQPGEKVSKKCKKDKVQFEVATNFVKASLLDECPKKCEDFSFIKKNKVKFNCVDLVVNEYQQDPEELEA